MESHTIISPKNNDSYELSLHIDMVLEKQALQCDYFAQGHQSHS